MDLTYLKLSAVYALIQRPCFFNARLLTRLNARVVWLVTLCVLSMGYASASQAQQIALTFDDGFQASSAGKQAVTDNQNTLAALKRYGIRSMLFPAGWSLDDKDNMALVATWGAAGHALGNHSFSHAFLSKSSTDEYFADIKRAEKILKPLPGWCPRLRFPYLDEGGTPEQRNQVMQWLSQNGYGVAGVTIGLPDWEFAERYLEIIKKGNKAEAKTFRENYLDQVMKEINKQREHWKQVLGRDPAHVLLLHTNHLNAEVLPQLLGRIKAQGWTFIDPATAFADYIYQRSYVAGGAGGSPSLTLPVPACH